MGSSKLTALEVTRAMRKGAPRMLNDGGGLYLRDGRAWVFRYARDGSKHDMGLGPALDVSLAEARGKAQEARRLLIDGKDPLIARRASVAASAKRVTFAKAAEDYIEAHGAGWTRKHVVQWRQTLARSVLPAIGEMDVAAVERDEVLGVLTPIWTSTPVTASRVRNRIESILDAAKALGLRTGENPARWRGHLDKLLPAPSKISRVEHFAAMPYREIGSFMAGLRQVDSVAARALEFVILTGARSGEGLGATWTEIDLYLKLWTIPARRMKKTRREHRVPLSDAAIAVVEQMASIRMNDFVFPGRGRGPLGGMMLLRTLGRLRQGVTVHGFRSTLRDWAGNETNFPRELCEQALAHVVGNSVEQAYRRGDALERRRALMEAWASYCNRSGLVVPFAPRETG